MAKNPHSGCIYVSDINVFSGREINSLCEVTMVTALHLGRQKKKILENDSRCL